MRTERMDIRLYRNADYYEGWQLTDADGAPIALNAVSMEMQIKAAASDSSGEILANADIDIVDPAQGIFTVRIDGADLSTVPGPKEIVRLAYDLRLAYADGVQAVPVAGQIILTPGVSF